MLPKILPRAAFLVMLACSGEPRSDAVRVDPPASSPERRDSTDDQRPAIVFLGTSLTAGLGVAPEEAYPALIQEKVDSAGLGFRVVNAGLSGETSAGGLRRLDWLLQLPIDVLVLELGANDALRGQDLDTMRVNLEAIIERTLAARPSARIVVAGMQAPPNMGTRYADAFRQTFFDIADEYDAALIPFLLEGVGGVPELNQADRIHPTAQGHRRLADTVWAVLLEVLPAP